MQVLLFMAFERRRFLCLLFLDLKLVLEEFDFLFAQATSFQLAKAARFSCKLQEYAKKLFVVLP